MSCLIRVAQGCLCFGYNGPRHITLIRNLAFIPHVIQTDLPWRRFDLTLSAQLFLLVAAWLNVSVVLLIPLSFFHSSLLFSLIVIPYLSFHLLSLLIHLSSNVSITPANVLFISITSNHSQLRLEWFYWIFYSAKVFNFIRAT